MSKFTQPKVGYIPQSLIYCDLDLLCRPQVVKERLLCHAIIGRAGGKELIMRVNVNCEFISPLLEFSSDLVFFRVDKVSSFRFSSWFLLCVTCSLPVIKRHSTSERLFQSFLTDLLMAFSAVQSMAGMLVDMSWEHVYPQVLETCLSRIFTPNC